MKHDTDTKSIYSRYLASGLAFNDLHYSFIVVICTSNTIDEEWVYTWNLQNYLETIASHFEKNANFSLCIIGVDRKHVRINCRIRSDSMFINYKDYFSVVLLAVAESEYCFEYVDVGSFGKDCDPSIFKQSTSWQSILTNLIIITWRKMPAGDRIS